ncbi:MAG: hypothetical protein NVSMB9_24800 [Isosphaeraceae bacterium]
MVGCADPDLGAAEALLARVAARQGEAPPSAFDDHRQLIRQLAPDAIAVFTPHLSHYRIAMDALQAGCHLFIEKPLSTNVQEATDIVGLARSRERKVGVGHQYRLRPSFAEARQRLAAGLLGPLKLVTATLTQPWLSNHQNAENSWRFDPKVAGGGVLADLGDHLIDAVLWTTGQTGAEAAAVQNRLESGLDVVTAATIRLSDGTPVTLALSGLSPYSLFELCFHGEEGRLRVTDQTLEEQSNDGQSRDVPLPQNLENIDRNFVSAILSNSPLSCPGEQALDTVRLLEAISRSAATGQVVRLA